MNSRAPLHMPMGGIDRDSATLLRAEAGSHPDWADVQNRLGLLQICNGEIDAALDTLRRCLELNPHYAWARLNLAAALALQGEFDEALRAAESGRDPGEGARNLTQIWIHLLAGRKNRATSVLSRIRPSLGERFDVAWAGHVAYRDSAAEAEREAAVALGDPVLESWSGARRPSWVAENPESSVCLFPGMHHLWQEVARIQGHQGRFEEARDAAHVAYLHWSDHGQYLILQGFLASLEGNGLAATRFYHEATDAAPQDPAGPIALAYMYAASGQTEPAMRYLRIALKRAPGYADLHRQLGLLERRAGRPRRAAAAFRRALEINPLYGTARLDLAQALYECLDWEGAIQEYESALAAGLASGDLHLHLGRAREMLGDEDGAARDYRRALELNPREALANYWLGGICRRAGSRDEAKSHWRRFVELTEDPELRGEVEALLRQEKASAHRRSEREDTDR